MGSPWGQLCFCRDQEPTGPPTLGAGCCRQLFPQQSSAALAASAGSQTSIIGLQGVHSWAGLSHPACPAPVQGLPSLRSPRPASQCESPHPCWTSGNRTPAFERKVQRTQAACLLPSSWASPVKASNSLSSPEKTSLLLVAPEHQFVALFTGSGRHLLLCGIFLSRGCRSCAPA